MINIMLINKFSGMVGRSLPPNKDGLKTALEALAFVGDAYYILLPSNKKIYKKNLPVNVDDYETDLELLYEMQNNNIKLKVLNKEVLLHLPERKTHGSSGHDLKSLESFTLVHGVPKLIKLGFAVQIPYGYEWQIRPRSSYGLRGIIMPNAPGTIDSDYRGEIGVELMSIRGNQPIYKGDCIAQAVLCEVDMRGYSVDDELDDTKRGNGGFGSTGS